MRHYFDTEFDDQGQNRLSLISIGFVTDDDREYYAESSEFNWAGANTWLQTHVRPYLAGGTRAKPLDQIAAELRAFIGADRWTPQFWGYFPALDWVNFVWLFGPWLKMPAGWPQGPCDLLQRSMHLGIDRGQWWPPQPTTVHNALNCARWTRDVSHWLDRQERRR